MNQMLAGAQHGSDKWLLTGQRDRSVLLEIQKHFGILIQLHYVVLSVDPSGGGETTVGYLSYYH